MSYSAGTSSAPAGPAIAGLDVLRSTGRKRPPVETWNPDRARDIDIRIAADGTWHYLGSPIGRPAMVRLFASILRRESDGRHALVTPVEKCFIAVDDTPFLAVGLQVAGTGSSQRVTFTTNLGDTAVADAGHSLTFSLCGGVLVPLIEIRSGLTARVNRATYYDLMNLAETADGTGDGAFGIWSGGIFWPVDGSPGGPHAGAGE